MNPVCLQKLKIHTLHSQSHLWLILIGAAPGWPFWWNQSTAWHPGFEAGYCTHAYNTCICRSVKDKAHDYMEQSKLWCKVLNPLASWAPARDLQGPFCVDVSMSPHFFCLPAASGFLCFLPQCKYMLVRCCADSKLPVVVNACISVGSLA